MSPGRGIAPLADRRVAVTREEEPGSGLGALLEDRGAEVLHWRAVRTLPPADPAALMAAAAALGDFDWLVCTSPRAVHALSATLGEGAALPADLSVAAVGEATSAAAEGAGWRVDRVAADAGATGLVARFREAGDLAGRRVLFPASSLARPVLVDGLAGLGATVVRVEAYRTEPGLADPDRVEADLAAGGADCLTFTSPSAVAGMVAGLGAVRFRALLADSAVAVMGPTTATALAGCGPRRLETAAGTSLEALVAAVVKSLEE